MKHPSLHKRTSTAAGHSAAAHAPRFSRRWFASLAGLALAATFSGCGSPDLSQYNTQFKNSDYAAATETATKSSGVGDKPAEFAKPANLQWQLNRGNAAFLAGTNATDPADAAKYLDTAQSDFEAADKAWRILDNEQFADVAKYIAAILVNDNQLSYAAKIFERFQIANYITLLDIQKGNFSKDYFLITEEVIQLAQARFKNEDKLKAEVAKKTPGLSFPSISYTPEQSAAANDSAFAGNSVLINPFSSYIAGLSALLGAQSKTGADLKGAYDTAQTRFREAFALYKGNRQAWRDWEKAKKGEPVQNHVWIIVENGVAPELKEIKITIPAVPFPVEKSDFGALKNLVSLLFNEIPKSIAKGGGTPANITNTLARAAQVPLVTIALAFPKIVPQNAKLENGKWTGEPTYLTVGADGKFYATEVIADFDSMAQLEYNKTFPAVVTREVIRVLVRTAAQVVAQKAAGAAAEKKGGAFGGAAASLGAAAVGGAAADALAKADTRQWASLPKNIQILSLPIPADRKITIGGLTGRSTPVEIPADAKNAVIYFRVPTTVEKAGTPKVFPIK